MECPKECLEKHDTLKKKLEGHDRTLYGQDGDGGIIARGNLFVRKSVLLIVALSLIGSMVVIGLWAADNKRSVSEAISDNKSNVMVNQANISNINANIADIKKQIDFMSETQKIILSNQVKALNEMHRIVRDGVK